MPNQSLGGGPYSITAAASPTSCMDVSNGSTGGNAVIQSYRCNGTAAQTWTLVPVSGNAGAGYNLVAANSGLCLDVRGASTSSGAVAIQWQCMGGNHLNQVWRFYPTGSSFQLLSLNSNLCLGRLNGDANALQQTDCGTTAGTAVSWNLSALAQASTSNQLSGMPNQSLGGGPYSISSAASPTSCMDVSGGSSNGNAVIQSFRCNGTPSQTWSLVPVSGSAGTGYNVIASNSGLCLDVRGASTGSGAVVIQWQCNGGNQLNQMWRFYPTGSSFRLLSMNSNLCLGRLNGDANALQQTDCGTTAGTAVSWSLTALTQTSLHAVSGTAMGTAILTAEVTSGGGVPTGTVTFFNGATAVGSAAVNGTGAATLSTNGLTVGSHVMSASYAGAAAFLPSTSPTEPLAVADISAGEQAFQADSFVDSVGVVTHLNYFNTAYGNWSSVLSALQKMGVRHIRDGIFTLDPTYPLYADHRTLAAAGIGCTCLVPLNMSETSQQLTAFSNALGDIDAFEDTNEADGDSTAGSTLQAQVNAAVGELQTLDGAEQSTGKPVVGPSFTRAEAYAAAGNIAPEINYNNLHVYFSGRAPGTGGWGGADAQGNPYGSFTYWMDQAHTDAPNTPVVITETGYVSGPTPAPYQVSEAVEAAYTPRTLLLAFNKGIKRTFLYELVDEWPNDTDYGLLNHDFSEKPAFTAVKNMNAVLSDKGASFTPTKLQYTLAGADSFVNHTLLQKRDGTFWLVLWLEESGFNEAAGTEVAVTPENLTLELGVFNAAKQVIRFDAAGNATATAVTGSATSVPLSVTDKLTIVQINPF